MPYYIRKIDKAKWMQTDASTSDIAADAITNCLNTKRNQLSFWKIDNIESGDIDEVLKAMITTFTSGIDTFDIIIIDELEIPTGIERIQSTSPTPYLSMSNYHYDFIELTLQKLTGLSQLIYSKITTTNVKRVTRSQGKNLIRTLVQNDPSFKEKLHSSIANSL